MVPRARRAGRPQERETPMVEITPKRVAEFIAPFRVEPGRRVRLPKDFDTAGTRQVSNREAKGILTDAIELLADLPDAPRGPGHVRGGGRAPGDGRGRQGRHDPPRHERREPAGRPGQQLQGPVQPRTSTTTTCGGTRRSCPRAATSASSTAPTTRRSSSSGSIRQILAGQKLPPKLKDRGDSGPAASARSTTGSDYLTDQGFRFVKLFLNLSKEEQRARFLSRIDEPDKNWKFSANDVKERAYWDDYQKAFSEVLSQHQHRVGAVVRHPCGRQAVRAGGRCRPSSPTP